MLLGITGQIGAGKSEVARIFKKYGAFIISADRIGKEVVEKHGSILSRLVRAFGSGILTGSGRLRRRALAGIAFSSEENKRRLNRIIHPALLKELDRRTRQAVKGYRLVVIDAALLIDWNWDKKVDMVIVVHASDKTKISRLVSNGYTEQEARQRLKSQLSFADFKKRADLVIFNNKSVAALEVKVRKIAEKLV